ncbi:MAG: hypothetical protein HOP03_09810 [Lysobacter sp.]|nr:hypothetical protein [Lysobacter sp.]
MLLPLLAACALWPGSARAQQPLNRCNGPGGNTIYTDRPCETIGASERLPRAAIAGAYGLRRGGCARNLQDLVYEITAAIDNRDVNRLGAVYHWVGQNSASGDRILDQLQAIVDRPLVDIVPLRGMVTEAPVTDPEAAPVAPFVSPAPTFTTAPPAGTDDAAPQPPRVIRRPPVGLRLEQTLGKGSTPSRTVLGLRRHLDCWWITL